MADVALSLLRPTRGLDPIKLSGRYLASGLLLGLGRIVWVIAASSGLLGRNPTAWVGSISAALGVLMAVYTALGALAFVEVARRLRSGQNQPISPLILNFFGLTLMLALAERVAFVAENQPQPFVTWAGLAVTGVTRGGVYALIALGYTLVYGILFMINFAHGEVVMLGAYAGYLAVEFLIAGGTRSFEAGAASLAIFFIPLLIGVMFLPLETLIGAVRKPSEETPRIAPAASPSWVFTLSSLPVRFFIGVAIGYGALVGLGGYAPNVYLLVITIVGVLFAVLCGMLTSMAVAVLLERVAYRPLRKAPRLAPLISAIGASIFLQQVALRVFGPNRKSYAGPDMLNDPKNFEIALGGALGVLKVSKVGVMVVLVSILLMVILYLIVQRTKIGKAMRAVAEDKPTAALMGINVDRVIVFTFMLGASLAGAGGVMLGFRGEDIDFRFGFTPGIKAFTAAVLGGIGNIPGAMLGGFFLGIVEALGPLLLGFEFKWQNVIAFSLLVLVLVFRPTGLLGERAQAKKV